MLRLLLISPVDKKKHTCCLETNNLLLYKFANHYLESLLLSGRKPFLLSYHHPGFERLCLCFDSFYTFATSRNYIITLQECPHLWSTIVVVKPRIEHMHLDSGRKKHNYRLQKAHSAQIVCDLNSLLLAYILVCSITKSLDLFSI